MQISVSGKHLDVGDALRRHITESLTATVGKYFGRAIDATAVISRQRHSFRADLAVHAGRGITVRAGDDADDAYAAFDLAATHLGKRLRRHKRRLREHHARGSEAASEAAMSYVLAAPEPVADTDAGEDAGTGADNPVVIAEDDARIERLTVSDAVMRMDLADLPALMFRNAAHDRLNVIYRRADGNIGWIDPRGT